MKAILASGFVGTLYGALAGGLFGSIFAPPIGTIFGMFWGGLSGFIGGAVSGSLGPRRFGLGGMVGALLGSWVAGQFMGVLGWLTPPILALTIGMWVSRELTSEKPDSSMGWFLGWLRRMFRESGVMSWPWWRRCLGGGMVLGAAAMIEWARVHFNVILW